MLYLDVASKNNMLVLLACWMRSELSSLTIGFSLLVSTRAEVDSFASLLCPEKPICVVLRGALDKEWSDCSKECFFNALTRTCDCDSTHHQEGTNAYCALSPPLICSKQFILKYRCYVKLWEQYTSTMFVVSYGYFQQNAFIVVRNPEVRGYVQSFS